ncbi:MAG: DUF4139 domain-containing protein, partial [Bryobacterales bacterium]|nr:DUF4139 domain-containing protein [Bryobacterales bacterium]
MRKLLIAAASVCACLAADLPVRTVILYKNGVGYFERGGELRAGESARLDFNASDMNDVLKSLTIEDKSGAKITGLRYDASEPLAKRLEDYPFQLGDQQPLSLFLDQLKGARLEIRAGAGEPVAGSIFSSGIVMTGEKAQQKQVLTLLLDSGDLRSYDLAAINEVRLADEALQRQLKAYLATLAVARSKEKRSVYIDSSDARARQIAASYMIPAPVWKSSYRLLWNEAAAVLEGWAIVDNTTGEDWTKVNLSLVSGRPISFISNLYEPKYVTRPVLELAENRAVAPVVDTGVVAGAPAGAPAAKAGLAGPRRMMEMTAQTVSVQAAAESLRGEMASTVAAEARGRELGDLFEYRFSTAVTVPKGQSAMLPFLQQKIGARKLLIYSDRSLQNPMTASEITNSSGKTLDGGPITVYEGGAYAGEALMQTVKAGDKRLITYGVDLGTRITTAIDSSRSLVREIHAGRGILTLKTAMEETLTYTIRNVDAKAKTLIIEHPIRPQYKLLDVKPVETTATAYRFEVKLAPNATERFPVREERVYDQGLSISSLTPDQLLVYIQNKALTAEGRRQLEAIAAKKRQIAQTDRAAREQDQEISDLVRDQDRIRQNLMSLNNVTGQTEQVNKYARQLAEQEGKLAGMRDRLSELRKQKSSQEQELNSLI